MQLIYNIILGLLCLESLVFWLPFAALTIAALAYWCVSRDILRYRYHWWTKASLAIPSVVTLEILAIGIWCYSQEDPGSEPLLEGILYLFLSLIPLAAYQVWRFRGCRRFVLYANLVQLWVAMSLTMQILFPLIHW